MGEPGDRNVDASSNPGLTAQRAIVTGAGGQLGRFLVPELRRAGALVTAFGSRPGPGIDHAFDLTDASAATHAIESAGPDIIIHAAACTDVDGIERDPDRGDRSNARATRVVAEAARQSGAYLIAVSTDMVFPGDGGAPYEEDAPTAPISAYGRSKLEAERAVLEGDATFAVARTAWLYGGAGKHFPRTVLSLLRDRGSIEVVDDEFGSPTYAADLAVALCQLASVRGAGVFHLINAGRTSRFDLARETAAGAGLDPELVRPVSTAAFLERYPLPAPRPPDSTLANTRAAARGIELRNWRDALTAYVPTLTAEIGPLASTESPPGG